MTVVLPAFPEHCKGQKAWIEYFGPFLLSLFKEGYYSFSETRTTSTLLVFERDTTCRLFIIPRPPKYWLPFDKDGQEFYDMWIGCFGRFFIEIQAMEFEYTSTSTAPYLFSPVNDRFYVFKKTDESPQRPFCCVVCQEVEPDHPQIICSAGHWVCSECRAKIVEHNQTCPICRGALLSAFVDVVL